MGWNIGRNMVGNLGGNLGRNLGGNLGRNMGGNMGGNLGRNMGGNLGRNLGGNLGRNLGGNMGRNMGGWGGNMGGSMGRNIGEHGAEHAEGVWPPLTRWRSKSQLPPCICYPPSDGFGRICSSDLYRSQPPTSLLTYFPAGPLPVRHVALGFQTRGRDNFVRTLAYR